MAGAEKRLTYDRLAELTDVEGDFLAASRDYADRQLAEEIARDDRARRGAAGGGGRRR